MCPSSIMSFCEVVVISSQILFTELAKWVELCTTRLVSELPKWKISDINAYSEFKQNSRRKVISLRALLEGLSEYSVEAQFLPGGGGVYWCLKGLKNHMKGNEKACVVDWIASPTSNSYIEALNPNISECDYIRRYDF